MVKSIFLAAIAIFLAVEIIPWVIAALIEIPLAILNEIGAIVQDVRERGL